MQERKERLAEKRRKKLENERKGEVVQKVRSSVYISVQIKSAFFLYVKDY